MNILLALGRETRMGAFYMQPTDPPGFLRLAFPDEDQLRCVSKQIDRIPPNRYTA